MRVSRHEAIKDPKMYLEDNTSENFKANLKLASSYYPSITEMCRQLGINRQQFMKYLSGRSFPTRFNLRKISDFFGFEEYELLMPHDQFSNILRLKPKHSGDNITLPPGVSSLLKTAKRQRSTLTKLHGYYYEYYLSFSTPGHILRSLTYIYDWKDYTLYKRIERLNREGRVGPQDLYKYAGIISMTGDRIHMIDRETLTESELTQKIMYPNYRNRVSTLTGLIIGVSGADAHEPSSSRVIMEYIGRTGNLRQAISECGIFPEGSPEIPQAIARHLTAGGRFNEPLRAAVFNPSKTE